MFRTVIYLAVASGLVFVSNQLELRGDVAPIVEGGVSPERAKYHILALIALIAAIGFFIAGGVRAIRSLRG